MSGAGQVTGLLRAWGAGDAEALHVSTDTVKRDWRIAKMWLLAELKDRLRDD